MLVRVLPLAVAEARADRQTQSERAVLWAAISVQEPILFEGGTDGLQVSFGVVTMDLPLWTQKSTQRTC